MLSCAEDLDAFLGEVRVETGKRETRTIDGRFADFSMKPDARPFQFHLQLFGVRIVETLDRYDWNCFALTARR
jgi:hypothetical protein